MLEYPLRRNYVFTQHGFQARLQQQFDDPFLSVRISVERGQVGKMEVVGGRRQKLLAGIPVFKLGVLIPEMRGGRMPPADLTKIFHETRGALATHAGQHKKNPVAETIVDALEAAHGRF